MIKKTDGPCHYCPSIGTTWDHVVPKSKGGSDKAYNLVLACEPCNARKSDALPTCWCDFCARAVEVWTTQKATGTLTKKRMKKISKKSWHVCTDECVKYNFCSVDTGR